MNNDDADSISLAETNKIRAQLGLPLIPVEKYEEPKTSDASSASGANELSIEETNRIRASLGLRPLETVATSSVDQDAKARDNWLKKKQEEEAARELKKQQKQQEIAQEQELRKQKLEGKGILDSEESDVNHGKSKVSTKSFLKNLKKRAKPVIQRDDDEEEEEEKVERQTPLQEYTSKDVAGLKVGHKLSDIQDLDQDTVLTLKDDDVLNEDGEDVLESSVLREKEKLEENLKNRKGARKHNAFEGTKYLDEMEQERNEGNPEEDSFILGTSIPASVPKRSEEDDGSNRVTDSIDFEIGLDATSADYVPSKPAKFKKSKKPKKALGSAPPPLKRRRHADEEEDHEFFVKAQTVAPVEEDDEDLQATLSNNRRKVQKQRRVLTTEEIAEKVLESAPQESSSMNKSFLETIKNARSIQSQDSDEGLDGSDQEVEERNEKQTRPGEPDDSEKMDIDQDQDSPKKHTHEQGDGEATHMNEQGSYGADTQQNANARSVSSLLADPNHENKSTVSSMSNILSALKTTGRLDKETDEEKSLRRKKRELQIKKDELRRWLEREFEQAKTDARSNTTGSIQQRERRQEERNKKIQTEYNRKIAALFREYEFDVQIRRHNAQGEEMTEKEAYKELSHQFHGVGPGKQKIEKEIQKRKEEKKRQAKPLFDA